VIIIATTYWKVPGFENCLARRLCVLTEFHSIHLTIQENAIIVIRNRKTEHIFPSFPFTCPAMARMSTCRWLQRFGWPYQYLCAVYYHTLLPINWITEYIPILIDLYKNVNYDLSVSTPFPCVDYMLLKLRYISGIQDHLQTAYHVKEKEFPFNIVLDLKLHVINLAIIVTCLFQEQKV
jgi:hypothetical protein